MNPLVTSFVRSFANAMPTPVLGEFDVSETIAIDVTQNTNNVGLIGPIILNSKITDGSPVLLIRVPVDGVNLTNLVLDRIQINGNGQEGAGIRIECPTNNSWVYRSVLRDITATGCGGNGVEIIGSVFESSMFNVWANDNRNAGLLFAHQGGQVSAWALFGGGARKNAGAGISLQNGARDVKMLGMYFCENKNFGIVADQGCTLIEGCGFENNQPGGLTFQNFVNLVTCTFSTHGVQNPALNGYLAGNISLINTGNEDYGAGQSRFARLDGNGTVYLINSQMPDCAPGVIVKGM